MCSTLYMHYMYVHCVFHFVAIAGAPFTRQSGTAANEDWIAIQLATACANKMSKIRVLEQGRLLRCLSAVGLRYKRS